MTCALRIPTHFFLLSLRRGQGRMCCYGIKTFLFFLERFKEDMRYCNECCLICRLRFSTIFGSSKIKIFGWNNCAIFLIKWCWRISIGLNLETSGVDVLLLKPRKDRSEERRV